MSAKMEKLPADEALCMCIVCYKVLYFLMRTIMKDTEGNRRPDPIQRYSNGDHSL